MSPQQHAGRNPRNWITPAHLQLCDSAPQGVHKLRCLCRSLEA